MSRDPILGMFASRRRPKYALAQLKLERTYRQTRELILKDRVFGLASLVTGSVKAATWDVSPNSLPFSKDWVQELGWLAHSITNSRQAIQDFLSTSHEFYRQYMLGGFEEAAKILNKIEISHGKSFWLAEHQFMLYQAREGFDDHKAHLSHLQSTIRDALASYLITMISNRLEPHVTPEIFKTTLEKVLTDLRSANRTWLSAILELQLHPWSNEWKSQAHEMLSSCYGRPLVDRYNLIKKILSYSLNANLPAPQKAQLDEILSDLHSATKDSFFNRTAALICKRPTLYPLNSPPKLLDALDKFWCGDFSGSANLSEQLLKEDPTCFAYYWLLARATACDSASLTIEINPKSPAYRILKGLNQVAANQLSIEASLLDLQAAALKLGDLPLGLDTWLFASGELEGAYDIPTLFSAMSRSDIHNPEDILIETKRPFFECFAQSTEARPSTCFLSLRISKTEQSSENEATKIHPAFQAVQKAEAAIEKGLFDTALATLKLLKEKEQNSVLHSFLAGDIAELEFSACIKSNRPTDAAQSVLSHYISNKNSLRHVDFDQLIDGANDGRWPEIKKTAVYPALVFLSNKDEQDIYEAVDDFLIANGLASPRELLNNIGQLQIEVSRVLLRDVLVSPVLMRGALWASSPQEERDLRTEILRKLFSISIEDQALVVEELAAVEHLKLLEEAYQNVEGPKFSADFVEQNRLLAELLEGTFERYLAYKSYEEKGGQLANESILLEQLTSGSSKATGERKSETSDVLLTNLVFTITAEYIWSSRKGMNATLGTRIRHGSLENQLMRIFRANNLLATKEQKGHYTLHKTITNIIASCDEEQKVDIQNGIINFTHAVNSIYTDLLDRLRFRAPPTIISYLQEGGTTKELASETGLIDTSEIFSESFSDKVKATHPKAITTLVAEVARLFEESLSKAMAATREYIRTKVAKEIDEALQILDGVITRTLPDNFERAQLRAKAMTAKDGAPHDLEIIQNWFAFAKRIDTGISSTSRLFSTAEKVINFASNGALGRMQPEEVEELPIAPDEGVVLYEVLSILLRNIVQHSKMDVESYVTYSFTTEPDGTRRLAVSNLLPDSESCSKAIAAAHERLEAPKDPRVLDRSPGGTGLCRIQALLKQVSNRAIEVIPSSGKSDRHFKVSIAF